MMVRSLWRKMLLKRLPRKKLARREPQMKRHRRQALSRAKVLRHARPHMQPCQARGLAEDLPACAALCDTTRTLRGSLARSCENEAVVHMRVRRTDVQT